MYLHHMEMFLFVGEKGRATYAEIQEEFNTSNASVSRSICSMSEEANHRKLATGLVEKFPDPADGRRHMTRLTKKGEQIYKLISSLG